nr:HAD hydrolase-like protein [Pseudoalteromonas sp. S409]
MPKCIATSSSPARTEKALNVVKLRHYFDEVFTSSEVKNGYPAPELFINAA